MQIFLFTEPGNDASAVEGNEKHSSEEETESENEESEINLADSAESETDSDVVVRYEILL